MSKGAIIGASTVLVVAVVAAVCVVSFKGAGKDGEDDGQLSTSIKSVKAFCQPMDFPQTCEDELTKVAGNASSPSELAQVIFEVTSQKITKAISESKTLNDLQNDKRTAGALQDCKEMLGYAVEDLKTSFDKLGGFEMTNFHKAADDLKTWLSATLTYQETCLDGFMNTTTDAAAKMRSALNSSQELTENILAVVDDFSAMIGSLSFRRRLLGEDNMPVWLSEGKRHLMEASPGPSPRAAPEASPEAAPSSSPEASPGPSPEASPEAAPSSAPEASKASPGPSPKAALEAAPSSAPEASPGPSPNAAPEAAPSSAPEASPGPYPEEALNSAPKAAPSSAPEAAPGASPEAASSDTPEAAPSASSEAMEFKPNVTVAADGSGDFKTINEALAKVPLKSAEMYVMHVKAGTYKEYVTVARNVTNLVMIGDGASKTIITGNKNFKMNLTTKDTATMEAIGNGFFMRGIKVENTAGAENHQAVALRVQSDLAVFYQCTFDGFQDTLYTHAQRQFFRDCTISGTIDFIFGNSQVVIQNCLIQARKPMDNQVNIITAQGRREKRSVGGMVLHNCTVTAHPDFEAYTGKISTYLARPWKEYSRTLYIQNELGALINPTGWLEWNGTYGLDTLFYAEVDNHGPGADTGKRAKWGGIKTVTYEEAQKEFTVEKFIQGEQFIPKYGVPFIPGLLPQAEKGS